MLCLKKVYTDELLQIAILLSLLRVDRNSNVGYDVPAIGVGINDDINGWEQTPHTLIRRDVQVHPKNLDSIILNNYEQHVFDELNSLGRYNRINVLRNDVTAYLLNVDDASSSTTTSSSSSNTGVDSPAGSSFTIDNNHTIDENGSHSGNDADSEGSSEMEPDDILPDPIPESKRLCPDDDGDQLTQEDMDLIEVLWKQDVDLGLVTDTLNQDESFDCLKPPPPASSVLDQKIKKPPNYEKDQSKPGSAIKEEEIEEEINPWAGLSYTVDLETGEYILKDEPIGDDVSSSIPEEAPSSSLIDQSDFSLAEALELVGLDEDTFELPGTEESEKLLLENDGTEQENSGERQRIQSAATNFSEEEEEEEAKEKETEEGDTGIASPSSGGDELEVFDDLLTEMIQTPSQYHRSLQGRMPYVRTMSMEQRWQDLANLLSLPDPNHPYHHFHPHPGSPYPGSPYPGTAPGSYHGHSHTGTEAAVTPRNVLIHNATLAPPVGEINGTTTPYSSLSNANLGSAVATSMNLTNSSEPMGSDPPGSAFKMENHDMMYYQNGTSEMNHTTEGFLSSILNDEDLQLMDMAMNEGMYTMRMLDGGGACAERGADSDSAVSSMGSERVPSLSSDTEWMETNSDSGHTPADHYGDYHSNKYRWYDYSYSNRQHSGEHSAVSNGNTARIHPVAQKKHHMYGKRFFQEQANGAPSSSLLPHSTSHSTMSNVKFEFPGGADGSQAAGGIISTNSFATAPPLDISKPHQSEMKYSCSLEFSRQNLGVRNPMEHVAHNHTYHLPPEQAGAMQRPISRDKLKAKKSEEEHMTRDEKRARALNVPLAVSDIINLPMDEFNERLSKYDLSESQLSLIRDIRRRGKNKVAAQNCRKRKLDQIMCLADEVKQMRERKQRLVREHDFLLSERQRVKNKLSQLYRHIFQALRDAEGNPYSPYEWSLQQAADGSVILVPRSNSSSMLEQTQTEPTPSKHSKQPDPDPRKQ